MCYLFILPSLPHPLPSTAIIASSTSLPCTSSSISVSTAPAGESCGGWYAVYTVSVHVLVASVSVRIYIPFKCNLLSLSLHLFPPSTATVTSSPDPQSLPSVSPVSVSTTPPGECSGLCTLTICKPYTVRTIVCTNLLNDLRHRFSQVGGPPCQSYFVSKYLSKSVLTTPHLGSSFSMTRQAVGYVASRRSVKVMLRM